MGKSGLAEDMHSPTFCCWLLEKELARVRVGAADLETSGDCEAGGVYGIRSVAVLLKADRSGVK